MISNTLKYATKVWLTSVLLSPFVFLLFMGTVDAQKLQTEAIGTGGFVFFSLLFGFVLSIPNWIVFVFVTRFINRKFSAHPQKKLPLAIAGMMLTYILFALVFFSDGVRGQQIFHLLLLTAYCSTIGAGAVLYKLKPDE